MLPPAEGPGGSAGSYVAVAAKLDALVLIGGADLDPSVYGAERDPETGAPQPWRDRNELCLLEAFMDAGKPVLGVCRGIQVLNSFLGGTLHQHVPDLVGHRCHQPEPGVFGETDVLAVPGSRVAAAMGESFTVCCCHHQAVDRPGDGLRVTATSDDGVTEAVELEAGFVVGVQWHPEQSDDPRLFAGLVAAC